MLGGGINDKFDFTGSVGLYFLPNGPTGFALANSNNVPFTRTGIDPPVEWDLSPGGFGPPGVYGVVAEVSGGPTGVQAFVVLDSDNKAQNLQW